MLLKLENLSRKRGLVAVLVAGAAAGAALVLLLYGMRGTVKALRSVDVPAAAPEPAAAVA